MVKYKRRSAERAILRALKNLGGSASRDALRNSIANDKNSGFTYEEVFNSVTSKNGGKYNPFYSTLTLVLTICMRLAM